MHVSNLCPRQGAGGVPCCARFISNKISLLALKKFLSNHLAGQSCKLLRKKVK
jgi:hypothetical protein